MLYKVIEATARLRINALQVLELCAQQQHLQADWAMNPHTACPDIPLNATALTLLAQLREVPLFNSHRPVRAWSNLLQAQEVMARPDWVHALAEGPMLGLQLIKHVLLIFLCVPSAFFLMHKAVLTRVCASYRGLDESQRLVTCQHAVYALVFGLQLVPQVRGILKVTDSGSSVDAHRCIL